MYHRVKNDSTMIQLFSKILCLYTNACTLVYARPLTKVFLTPIKKRPLTKVFLTPIKNRPLTKVLLTPIKKRSLNKDFLTPTKVILTPLTN